MGMRRLVGAVSAGIVTLGGGGAVLAQTGVVDLPTPAGEHAQGQPAGGDDESAEDNGGANAEAFSAWVRSLELEGCERGQTVAHNARRGPTSFTEPEAFPGELPGKCADGEEAEQDEGQETAEDDGGANAEAFSAWVRSLELEGCERGQTVAHNARRGPTSFTEPEAFPGELPGRCAEGGEDTEAEGRETAADASGGRSADAGAEGREQAADASGGRSAEPGAEGREQAADASGGRSADAGAEGRETAADASGGRSADAGAEGREQAADASGGRSAERGGGGA